MDDVDGRGLAGHGGFGFPDEFVVIVEPKRKGKKKKGGSVLAW